MRNVVVGWLVIFGTVTMATVAAMIYYMWANAPSSSPFGSGENEPLEAREWYNGDWEFAREDVRAGKEGELFTTSLEFAYSWDHDNCAGVFVDGEDSALLEDCNYGIEAHYVRPDLEMEFCQRVLEFSNEDAPLAIEELFDTTDLEPTDSSPVACQANLDAGENYLTRARSEGDFLVLTVASWSLEEPSEDEYYDILTAINYRHTEIGNAVMWKNGF
ncbi:hypothetical protein [Natronoglycomyces albus]|uniref:Uncharacterized protein n=1 Tax=Natronoglycomyces albus TaxID=2811108 RepID=A0A895XKG4_9ACTN|nr:hypothetical protein [Natronoglycomyces albus]QSB04053.1 hypothetical protein JQS30_09495 [Natronoglycomyces albus]